jgi:hypothetical protein
LGVDGEIGQAQLPREVQNGFVDDLQQAGLPSDLIEFVDREIGWHGSRQTRLIDFQQCS